METPQCLQKCIPFKENIKDKVHKTKGTEISRKDKNKDVFLNFHNFHKIITVHVNNI